MCEKVIASLYILFLKTDIRYMRYQGGVLIGLIFSSEQHRYTPMAYCQAVCTSIKESLSTQLNENTNPETKRKQIFCVLLASWTYPWPVCLSILVGLDKNALNHCLCQHCETSPCLSAKSRWCSPHTAKSSAGHLHHRHWERSSSFWRERWETWLPWA